MDQNDKLAASRNGMYERLLTELNAKEDLTLRLGDALDVKASIGLAIILFLATQSDSFFDKCLPPWGFWVQICSVICIVGGALCAIAELWPRTYILPQPESDVISRRIAQLTEYYAANTDGPDQVEDALIADEIMWAKNRIADNQKKNWAKSNALNWSFWFTSGAIALNLLTLAILIKK
jgi:hypothetical protein